MPLALQSVNGIHVAALSGPLDNSAGTDLVTSIKASVEKGSSIVLDCTLVSSMDVAGFKHLLALHRWSQVGNGRLILAGMSPEAWSLIVENHCENTFESRPSVPAAFQALGVGGAPAYSEAPPAPADDYGAYPTPPAEYSTGSIPLDNDPYVQQEYSAPPAPAPVASHEDPWAQTLSEAPPASSYNPAPPPAWHTPPPGGDGDDPWAQMEERDTKEREKKAAARKGSKAPLIIGLGVLVLALAGGGYWYLDSTKVPVIEVSETAVEVQEGKELRPVEITVTNGVLDEEAIELPAGLAVVDETGDEPVDGKRIYSVLGAPDKGAESKDVSFTAAREKGSSRKSAPATLAIKILEKPLEWSFSPHGLQVGNEITGYTTIVTGAKSAAFSRPAEAPGGLEVKVSPKNPESWVIAGTPTAAGSFDVEFTAVSRGGNKETKTFPVKIEPAPPPPPPPPPPVEVAAAAPAPAPAGGAPGAPATSSAPAASSPSTTPSSTTGLVDLPVSPGGAGGGVASPSPAPAVAPAPAVVSAEARAEKAKVDDAMRTFLLERIEKANDHFTFEEKTKLRQMVGLLTDARMVARITFPTGKMTLMEREKRNLKDALSDTGNRALLDDPGCQILVVGYASPSGSRSTNIRLSRGRANAVNSQLRSVLGRGADLCGDYGPTEIVSDEQLGNQAVEIFAGKIELPDFLEEVADKFKEDFNERHGGR